MVAEDVQHGQAGEVDLLEGLAAGDDGVSGEALDGLKNSRHSLRKHDHCTVNWYHTIPLPGQ